MYQNIYKYKKLLINITALTIVILISILFSPNSSGQDPRQEKDNASGPKNSLASRLFESTKNRYPDSVEIIAKRTPTSKTYLLETLLDGRKKYALDSAAEPIHYNKGGTWEEIDTTLIPIFGEWDFGMEKADYSFYVKKLLNSSKLVEFRKGGEYIRLAPESLSYSSESEEELLDALHPVEGQVRDDTISWSGAFGQGTELLWQALPGELAKTFKI